jgi:hypothetical protein
LLVIAPASSHDNTVPLGDGYRKVVISLCDLTGHMVQPWVDAGYEAVLVDPQHPPGATVEGKVTKIGCVIMDALSHLGPLVRSGRVVFVAGFPPCTDVAVSGARWWEAKREADPYFQAKAALVAEQCRMIGELSGAPWFFENPVSAFSKIFGAPSYSFNPYDFTGYCADDNYTKKTCLWTGVGFRMPATFRDASLGKPDNRIHACPPSDERANIRSATPLGFARAVFERNRPLAVVNANDNIIDQEIEALIG